MLKMALFDCAINEKCCSVDGGRGICPLFSSPPRGIWQLKSPHPREFAIQGKTNGNALGSAWGWEGGGLGTAGIDWCIIRKGLHFWAFKRYHCITFLPLNNYCQDLTIVIVTNTYTCPILKGALPGRGAGGGLLPIMAYMGRLCRKGGTFFRVQPYKKGTDFTWSKWRGREICLFGQ